MSRKQYIGITLVITAVIFGVGYIYLGGLNKVQYSIENVNEYLIVGRPFEGKSDDNQIEQAFFEAKGLLSDGRLNGTLTLVHYKDTSLAEGNVKMFIGVLLAEGVDALPVDYDRLTISANQAMRATIGAHNMVMPSPQTIEDNLRAKAAEYALELQDFTIEQYVGDRQLLIDMPAR
jgi:hypothetical protein